MDDSSFVTSPINDAFNEPKIYCVHVTAQKQVRMTKFVQIPICETHTYSVLVHLRSLNRFGWPFRWDSHSLTKCEVRTTKHHAATLKMTELSGASISIKDAIFVPNTVHVEPVSNQVRRRKGTWMICLLYQALSMMLSRSRRYTVSTSRHWGLAWYERNSVFDTGRQEINK